jgi:hypothetical protein
VEIVSSAATQMIISNEDSPVVRAVLDELVERLQEKPPSQQFALQNHSNTGVRSILQRPVPPPPQRPKKFRRSPGRFG